MLQVRSIGIVATSLALGLAGCADGSAPPRLPETPKPIEGHLLSFPHADAEALLGREVTRSDHGGLRVADARAPGCDVVVHRTKAQYHALREAKTSELASVGASYQMFLSLAAKYGRESHARLELENRETLEADLRGQCGHTVITKVFVGHGSRRVFAASSTEASASLKTPAGTIGPRGEVTGQISDALAWQDDQAYAFDVRDFATAASDTIAVEVHVPSIVDEGEELRISFESSREAWLVVYYVDADNKAEVLWPSNEEPAPSVKPSKVTVLPSPAEHAAGIKIRPTLSKPGVGAREQLIVYAFADRRDFDLVKPPSGSSSASGVAFADELVKKLRDIPASRWSRRELGYSITPTKK